MKKLILSLLAISMGGLLANAQTIIGTDGFGRYQINDYLTSPSFSSGSWGPGQGTFGFNPGGTGDHTWAQFLQFDAQGSEALFNAATTFSLSLSTDFANGGRSYTIFANAGNADIAAATAGFNMINNTTGVSGNVALGGTAIVTGSTSGGEITVSSAALDTFLSGVDFDSNRFVYFTFVGDTSSTAGGTVALGNSSLTAIPEPAAYGFIFAAAALGIVLLRRQRN